MPANVWLYSVEPFPGSKTSGRHTEFLETNGITILHPGNQWVRLDPYYIRYYWTDYKHRGDQPTEIAKKRAIKERIYADEIATRFCGIYSRMGVVSMDEDPEKNPERAAELVAQAKAANHAWRVSIVRGFESQLKQFELSGHGRLEPTLLENESYKALGLELPGTIESIKAHNTMKLDLPPELLQLIELGIAAKQAQATPAGHANGKVK